MIADAAGAFLRLGTRSAARFERSGWLRSILAVTAFGTTTVLAILLTSTWFRVHDAGLTVPQTAIDRLDYAAGLVAYETQITSGRDRIGTLSPEEFAQKLPRLVTEDGRVAFVADETGEIVAATDPAARPGQSLAGIFKQDIGQTGSDQTQVRHATLRNGVPALVALRQAAPYQVAIIQPLGAALRNQGSALLREGVPAFCFVAVLGLGAGCVRYRRRAKRERLLRSRSRRLDSSLSYGRCGIWDWDASRRRIFWSASMYQLLGYEPRGEHLGADELLAMLHPDDFAASDLQDPATRAGTLVDREIRVRTGFGSWLWLRIKGETIVDPADGSLHMIGLAIDVTGERRDAERRAREELRLRTALDALPEAFVLWDEDERLIVCNSKFLALNGLSDATTMPGMPARQLLATARPPLSSRTLDRPPADDEGARRTETLTADGRWFHVSEHRTRDGGLVSLGTDVTDIKRREDKLIAREEHLKGSVRAAETAAQCYAAAAERNFEANQAKTEFLARVSHELRTPLNAIIGFSDVMRLQMLGPLDERYAGYTAGIHASGLKLLEIIDGILQMSRIERGQFDLKPEALLIEDVVADVVATVHEDVEAKGIALETDITSPILVQADGAALREILLQIVRNAVKFSLCQGRVRIRIRAAASRINVFVEDAGIGISSDVLPGLSMPFAQVEAEYSRSCGGAGLGLAIARSLIDMHGGRLALRSQPSVGTIALISLPKVQPAANDVMPSPSERPLVRRAAAAG